MTPLLALGLLIGLLALTAGLAVLARNRPGRARRIDHAAHVAPEEFGIDGFGTEGTVVQFSTAYCSRCPGTRRVLSELVARYSGVDFVHVDVTDQPHLASKHRLLQTPTVLILDGGGVPRSRFTGTIDRRTITRELEQIAGDPHHD
ncbi:thioredoxin family protein [Leucobacter sp.]